MRTTAIILLIILLPALCFANGKVAAIKKGQEESGMYEAMRGGHDIVDHHMIYDHSDLSKNIMKMTRSMHMKLHQLFRKHGIVVPHINVNGE